MMKLISILVTTIICILPACNEVCSVFFMDKTSRSIYGYLNDYYPKDNLDSICIDLRQVLKKDYDSLFVFCEYTPDNLISMVLKQNYTSPRRLKYIPDSYSRIILLKKDSIIYQDNYYHGFIYIDNITVRRDSVDKECLIHYSPYYLVKRSSNESGFLFPKYSYSLIQISDRESLSMH